MSRANLVGVRVAELARQWARLRIGESARGVKGTGRGGSIHVAVSPWGRVVRFRCAEGAE